MALAPPAPPAWAPGKCQGKSGWAWAVAGVGGSELCCEPGVVSLGQVVEAKGSWAPGIR